MHRPAFTRPQWRPIGTRRARTRALKNRLSWHRTSRSRAQSSSRGRAGRTRRRCRPQGCLVHRTRPSLRNDHSWRRHRRWRWRTRGRRSGCHSRHLWRRRRGPKGRHDWRCGTDRRPRCRNRWSCESWRGRCPWRRGVRRSGRRRSRKGWPRARSWNHKFRRSGRRRRRRLRDSNGCGRRCRRGRTLDFDRRQSIRGPLLFADDGF
jgi:hypothetical protein